MTQLIYHGSEGEVCPESAGRNGKPRGAPSRRSATAFTTIALIALAGFVAMALLPKTAVFAQATGSRVASIDPASGKVSDQVTAAGQNLGKGVVVGIFLSDDKDDYKATIVDQDADKISFKIPQVKAGSYNVSIQVGANLLIQPVRFSVEE